MKFVLKVLAVIMVFAIITCTVNVINKDLTYGISVYAEDDASDDTQDDKSDKTTNQVQALIMYVVTFGCLAIIIEWIISSIVKARRNRKNQFSRE